MPQTIRMPDGTLISNVPDNYVPPAELRDPVSMQQWSDELSPVMSGLLEMRQYIADRLPDGMLRDLPEGALEASREENPVGSAIGQAYFPVAAGLATPGRMVAQGAVAGGLEAMRMVGGEGSLQETAGEAGKAALATGVFNLGARVATGSYNAYRAYKTGQALRNTSPVARTISELGVGRGMVDNLNQFALRQRLGRILGVGSIKEITPDVLQRASGNFTRGYNRVLSLTDNVDTAAVQRAVDAVDKNFPGRKALMEQIAKLNGTSDSVGLRALHRTMRETLGKMRKTPELAAWADEFEKGVTALDDAAIQAGVDPQALGVINQRYKIFKTIEETPDAWIGGRLNPRQLSGKFGRQNSLFQLTGGHIPQMVHDLAEFKEVGAHQPVVRNFFQAHDLTIPRKRTQMKTRLPDLKSGRNLSRPSSA